MDGVQKDMSRLVAYLGKINDKRIHVQAVQETRKALSKPAEALVHELKVHQVRFQVGHRVTELGKLGLEGVQGRWPGEWVVLRRPE